MKIVSLFSGAGGLDLGFSRAGFEIIWANEYDKKIFPTYIRNHPRTFLRECSIVDVRSDEIPDAEGIIGGPPCQPWSLAGAMKGLRDERGAVIREYLRVIEDKKPLFFLFENVAGMVSRAHKSFFLEIAKEFKEKLGYLVNFKLLNAYDYGVPQERKRVFLVGFRQDLGMIFSFPKPGLYKRNNLKDAIFDLWREKPAAPALNKNRANKDLLVPNHEYYIGSFSPIYMSRNRIRRWDEPSFTIQASGRHAPLHPSCPPMKNVGKDKWEFTGPPNAYRRLSVRECARVQTFPDNFIFEYDNVSIGYRMVGNAVPVKLAQILAEAIKQQLLGNIEQPYVEDLPLVVKFINDQL